MTVKRPIHPGKKWLHWDSKFCASSKFYIKNCLTKRGCMSPPTSIRFPLCPSKNSSPNHQHKISLNTFCQTLLPGCFIRSKVDNASNIIQSGNSERVLGALRHLYLLYLLYLLLLLLLLLLVVVVLVVVVFVLLLLSLSLSLSLALSLSLSLLSSSWLLLLLVCWFVGLLVCWLLVVVCCLTFVV